MMISVDYEKCIDCGRCVDVCPAQIYTWNESAEKKQVLVQYEEMCILCGHCIAICPEDAITHEKLPSKDFLLLEPINITPEMLTNLLLARRSIRSYKSDPVPREVIDQLLNVGIHAGTASNLQNIKFTVVQQTDILVELEDLVIESLWSRISKLGNPIYKRLVRFRYSGSQLQAITRYYESFKRRIERKETRGRIFRGAPAAIMLHTSGKGSLQSANCAIAIANMTILAQTTGLGVSWIGFLVEAAFREPRIKKLLEIPDYRHVHGCIIVGYPKYTYKKSVPRNPARVQWF
ncbi:MAG: nitroreductase family protein [Candidatus Hodarchaeales archaeon]|jgi:nitroreductase/NAD-dependent dihydropyrimidine dehydrogenase PreA subunit